MQGKLIGSLVGLAWLVPISSAAQPIPTPAEADQPNRVSVEYVLPENSGFHALYDLLRDRRALEKVQEILSPFRLPEELRIKVAECGKVNAFYTRENSRPTVTICYEYLKHVLESLPNETTPAGLTPADAAVGQFLWMTLHEVGHAIFDIFQVPIFGHAEDAADDFATFIMLQFGQGQARRLIGGAAWAWRAYVGDYKRNPVVPTRLTSFADDHGLPQERFYNLLCLAAGADPVQFSDLFEYLPPTRSQRCALEYQTLFRAFHKEITPHIDLEMAKRVLDTSWLPVSDSGPAANK